MENNQASGDKREENGQEKALKRTTEEIQEESFESQSKKLKLEGEAVEETQIPTENDVKSDKTSDKKLESNKELEDHEDQKDVKTVKSKINFSRKKKCVLLLSYCGSGYNGMQRNPGVRTIEEDLTKALFETNAITEDAFRNFGKMSFQRCARTDKGVSAARQVVSLKVVHMVPAKELVPEINKLLEPQIRVFALKQVTRGFDCKSRCTSRTYEYLLPTFAFSASYAQHTTASFRITREIRNEINEILVQYTGTKNFHNFTSGRGFGEESSKRYIISFQIAGEPFVEKETEFLVLRVEGQSFMQHQIRKMIGLMIAMVRKSTDGDAIQRSFKEAKMDIPRAPGLGLVLDQVHFKSYNEKFGKDGVHEPLEWSECEDKIVDFKKKFIYSKIIETELKTKSMMRWLNTLCLHTYSSAGMMERNADKTAAIVNESDSSSCTPDTTAPDKTVATVENRESPTRAPDTSMLDEETEDGK